jgi:hypothetical protein
MRRSVLHIGITSVTAALLVACGGGGGGGTSQSTVPGARNGVSTNGQAQITIPNATTSSKARRAQFLSAAAVSAGMSVNGGAATFSDVSSASAACVPVSGGRTCTIDFSAFPGNDTFVLTLYDGPNGTGNNLGSATTSQTVSSTPFSVAMSVGAVVTSAVFSITPNHMQGPASATATLTVVAKDADGDTISGPAPYNAPITVSENDTTGGVTLSAPAFIKPGDTITIAYTGAAATASTTFTTQGIPTVTPAVLAIQPPHQSLFAADPNPGGGGIYVFAPGANGNVAPIRAITGANTNITEAYSVSLDAAGFIYEADQATAKINVFAPDANGNVAPIRTIAGPNTGFIYPATVWGTAIDAAGDLWAVVVNLSTFTNGYLEEFAPGANGNVAPIATIAGSNALNNNSDTVAIDAAGKIHQAIYGISLLTFAPGSNGNVAPILDISGSNAFPSSGLYQMAFDANGNQYVAQQSAAGTDGIYGWSLSATGNVAPTFSLVGANTTLNTHVRGIAFDAGGYMYVSNSQNGIGLPLNGPTAINVFAPGASGNVAPVRVITGSNIGLVNVNYIAISP